LYSASEPLFDQSKKSFMNSNFANYRIEKLAFSTESGVLLHHKYFHLESIFLYCGSKR
jgi:hypothetical protein